MLVVFVVVGICVRTSAAFCCCLTGGDSRDGRTQMNVFGFGFGVVGRGFLVFLLLCG